MPKSQVVNKRLSVALIQHSDRETLATGRVGLAKPIGCLTRFVALVANSRRPLIGAWQCFDTYQNERLSQWSNEWKFRGR
jgi:hypothetical protein